MELFVGSETLLKTCWHRTPSRRPQAAEIVELLTNNTRLIQPCVGIPLSSMQIGGNTNSLELQTPAVVRKSTSTSCGSKGYMIPNAKLGAFDLSTSAVDPLSGNNDQSVADPLLNKSSSQSCTTQYITLQHGSSARDYISVAEAISSPV